jgi:cell division septation protein DedD
MNPSASARRESPAPWIVAAVAAVVLVAVVVVFFAVLLPYRRDHHGTATSHGHVVPQPGASGQPLGALTQQETAAMVAAGTEAANQLSYTRKSFAADFARALAGATGQLKADIEKQKDTILSTMTQHKFDLSAKVQHTALVGPTDRGHGYVVLVTVYGYTSAQLDLPLPENLSMTMVNVHGKWLASDSAAIGVS